MFQATRPPIAGGSGRPRCLSSLRCCSAFAKLCAGVRRINRGWRRIGGPCRSCSASTPFNCRPPASLSNLLTGVFVMRYAQIFFLSALACTLGCRGATPSTAAKEDAAGKVPHLVAEVTSHDGGEVDYARPRDYVFPVTNTGTGPLQ